MTHVSMLTVMLKRTLLFFLFCLHSHLGYSQTANQDTAYWETFDAQMVDRIWDGMEAPTTRKLFDSLRVELAVRLKHGPLTESLAYRYHWMSLRLKQYFPAEVKPYADTAIDLRIRVGAPTADIAQSHYEKGKLLRILGNDRESLSFFEDGVQIMNLAISEQDSIPDLAKRQAYFISSAAVSAVRNGNFELARLRLKQIQPLLRIDTSSLALQTAYVALINEGELEALAGNYDLSVQLYREGEKTEYFKRADFWNQGALKNNLGLTMVYAGRYKEAEAELTAAIPLYQAIERWQGLASAYINIMHLRVRQNRPQDALDLFQLAEETALKVDGANRGIIFGELYLFATLAAEGLGRTEEMEDFLAKTANALLADDELFGPAQLPRIEGNVIYGQPTLLQFLAAKREIFLNAYERSASNDDLLLAHATSYSIDTLMRLNRQQLNLTASLGQFISKEAEQYTEAIDIALKLHRNTGDIAYLNEAYQFAAGQKSNLLRRYLTSPNLAANLGVPEAIVIEKADLELRVLTTERALQNAAGPALRDSLLRLNAQVDKLKRQIATEYPAFARALRGFAAIDPAAAAATLDENQLVVEYFLSADSVYLFTLSQAEGLAVKIVERPDDLTDLIGSVVDQDAGATELYDLLIAPLLEDRPEITRLQLIPDGELWKLPFAALKNGDRFLIQDYALSFAYAAPLLFDPDLAARAAVQADNYLGYGISYQDILEGISASGNRSADARELRDMGQLPWAGREVETAASIIGGDYRLEHEATKDRFLAEAGEAGILHLSMHGLLRANPMESALVFRGNEADDFALLTMGEVLSGHYPAELTVLSACHTGGGDLQTSEGMQSIGRAFMAAGSQATITSAWEARDEATHDILVAFYEALANGETKDVALQGAIRTYLQNGTAADRRPENWANLTLTGSVTPLKKHKPWVAIVLGLGVALGMGAMALARLKKKAGTQDAG